MRAGGKGLQRSSNFLALPGSTQRAQRGVPCMLADFLALPGWSNRGALYGEGSCFLTMLLQASAHITLEFCTAWFSISNEVESACCIGSMQLLQHR